MSTRKVTEANQIFAKLLPLNEDLAKTCRCSFPHNRILSAYKMQDILLEAGCFVDPVVFALEYHQRGSRIFFCSSRLHFPHYFFRIRADESLREEFPTWHEILTNSNRCHLYFDLEYYTSHNPANLNHENIMTDFKRTLNEYLLGKYSNTDKLICTFSSASTIADIRFVEFDATIETKFSRHVIVILNKFSFESSSEVGKFVGRLHDEVEEFRKFTFTNKTGTKKESLMDLSVYHEGQNLRMLGSPKFGRSNTLLYVNPLENHEFKFHENCALCSRMLLDTLATVSNANSSQEKFFPMDDPIFQLTKNGLKEYANLVTNSIDVATGYEFLVRISACTLVEIYNLLNVDSNKSVLTSLKSLFEKVARAFQTGNTFWSFPAEFWDPILREIFEFLNFLHSTDDNNTDKIRFQLGRILVLLNSAKNSPTFETETDNSNEELNDEISAVSFYGVKLSKKCRQSLSYLLRFLQNFLLTIDNKNNSSTGVDFSDFTLKYQRLIHNLPSAMKVDFPKEISSANVHDIRLLVERLSECEGEIRQERSAKCAEKTAFLKENVQNRYRHETEFRRILEDARIKSEKNEPMFLGLCKLVRDHSLRLQFSL